jgi:two-component system, NarL family, sensor kinase
VTVRQYTTPPDCDALLGQLSADSVVVFAVDRDDLFVAAAAPRDARIAESLRIPLGFGVTGQVARDGHGVRMVRDSPRNLTHRRLVGMAPGDSISRICAPIPGLYGEIVGVLAAYRSDARPFTEEELTRATELASPLGLRMHTEQLWRAVGRHRGERDRLIAAAISAQEDERRRIAFDLHDGVITVLASLAFHLNAAELATRDLDAAAVARAQIAAAQQLADLAYHQTRGAISGLHSLVLDDLGLVAALESLIQSSTPAAGTEVELLTDPPAVLGEIPAHAAAALYRMAQEALSNAIRHAGAARIVVSLRRAGDALVLGCTDDGRGFAVQQARTTRTEPEDPTRQHFGLSSIEQRAALLGAELRLESTPGRGTRVIVELPVG